MLKAIGVNSFEDLISNIPPALPFERRSESASCIVRIRSRQAPQGTEREKHKYYIYNEFTLEAVLIDHITLHLVDHCDIKTGILHRLYSLPRRNCRREHYRWCMNINPRWASLSGLEVSQCIHVRWCKRACRSHHSWHPVSTGKIRYCWPELSTPNYRSVIKPIHRALILN